MAITAMGLGSKTLEGDYNLDPQDQFWSWLQGMAKDHSKGTIFSGFAVEPTDPAGLSVQIGGHALTPDSAVYYGDGTDGNFFARHNVLLSSDGTPTKVELSGASSSSDTTYYIVSYVMPASTVAVDKQTPGTPELVKTIAVTGAGYGAPTPAEIEAAKEAGAETGYVIWAQVVVPAGATTITSANITQANSMKGGNMRNSRGLLYDDSLTNLSLGHWYAEVKAFSNGVTIACARYGDLCVATISGAPKQNMGASGVTDETMPEWCGPWQTQPWCAGNFGAYAGRFWAVYTRQIRWVSAGSISAGTPIAGQLVFVANPASRPTS